MKFNQNQLFSWAPVPVDFSARHSCSGRAYKYAFPRTIRTLDVEAMQKACDLLVGTHDFRNFAMVRVQLSLIFKNINYASTNLQNQHFLHYNAYMLR